MVKTKMRESQTERRGKLTNIKARISVPDRFILDMTKRNGDVIDSNFLEISLP